jgi:hypothetical protein
MSANAWVLLWLLTLHGTADELEELLIESHAIMVSGQSN